MNCLKQKTLLEVIPENNHEEQGPKKLEFKNLPSILRYEFLVDNSTCPVIVSVDLSKEQIELLLEELRLHKKVIGYSLDDIKGINPLICMHRILLEQNIKLSVEFQRRLNPHIKDVVKKEVLKLLDAGVIYPVSDSSWVGPVHVIPKKGGITVIKNDSDELMPTRIVIS